jgi:ATP-dependent Clp protease ATP-binding subunit ClpC
MFERFTDAARETIVFAQESARERGDNYIGSEHLLLGVLRARDGTVTKVLESLGVSPEAIRQGIDSATQTDRPSRRGFGRRERVVSGHIPFTPRAKKVLELSLRESLTLGHDYIGTGHILLALIREGEGSAARTLTSLGVTLDAARDRVVEIMPAEPERPNRPHREARSASAVVHGIESRLSAIADRLAAIEARLTTIERRLDIEPGAAEPGESVNG